MHSKCQYLSPRMQAALKKYDFLKTYDQELQFVEEQIRFYKDMYGVKADWREVQVDPRAIIATQKFVEDAEYAVVSELVRSGDYTTPIVVEFIPCPFRRYVADGHNRTMTLALDDVEITDAIEMFFCDRTFRSGLVKRANEYGNLHVVDLPFGSRGAKTPPKSL